MAERIVFNAPLLQELFPTVQRFTSEVDNNSQRMYNAMSSLDMMVRERENLDSRITELRKKLEVQQQKMQQIGQSYQQASDRAGTVNSELTTMIGAIGTALITAAGVIGSIISGIISGGTDTRSSTISDDSWVKKAGDQVRGRVNNQGLKTYSNGTENYKNNDYSGFSVLGTYKKEAIFNQHDYDDLFMIDGKNQGCSSTSEAIAYSLNHPDEHVEIDSTWFDKNLPKGQRGALWNYSENVPKPRNLSTLYSLIHDENKPVIINLTNYHYVTAFGIRNGADINKLTPSDFLVIDPGDGKIKQLDQISNYGYKCEYTDNAQMRIPK